MTGGSRGRPQEHTKMADCSKISAGLAAASCDAVAVPGTASRLILLNYSDIDRTAVTEANNIVSALALSGAAVGYAFESLPDATVGSFALVAGTYINQYDHTIDGRIFVKSEAAKAFLNSLKNARVVAIVENKSFNAADATPIKYEIYGLSSGLEVSEVAGTTTFEDQTVATFKMTSGETAKEGTLPKTLFVTSVSATDTLVSGLLS